MNDSTTDRDTIRFVTCPECGNEQGDMGHGVQCEECGYAPMPTHDDDDESDEAAGRTK